MKKIIIIALAIFVFTGCSSKPEVVNNTNQIQETMSDQDQATSSAEAVTAKQAVIKTSKGDITVELYPESAPNTVKNFVNKATNKYYEKLTFHRVEDWVIQGGDPDGNGTGGGSMPTELSEVPFELGSLGVARGGNIEISNDSQFFVCTDDCAWLSGQYTNFGKVIEGLDIAKKITIGDTIDSIEVQN